MEADTRMVQRERTDELALAAAGDEIAFQRLIALHHDDMRRVCAYVAGDLGIADEATQAAWAIAWKRLGDVREPSPGACRPRGSLQHVHRSPRRAHLRARLRHRGP